MPYNTAVHSFHTKKLCSSAVKMHDWTLTDDYLAMVFAISGIILTYYYYYYCCCCYYYTR